MRCFRIGDLVRYAFEEPGKDFGWGIIIGCDNANPATADALVRWRCSAEGTTVIYYVLFPSEKNFGPYFGSELKLKQSAEDASG
jgi:hypothetical protein